MVHQKKISDISKKETLRVKNRVKKTKNLS